MDAPFDVVMQQATKLKTDQLAVFRRKYDSYPIWYQHSLFSVDLIINARKEFQFEDLYKLAIDLKELGSEHYKNDNIHGALNEYEKAMALFKWLEPTREDWKKRGLDDNEMIAGEYFPENEAEASLINELNIACLLNIALCFQHTKEWNHCIRACDEILNNYDKKCVKALYRRAMARIIPPSCGGLENSIALKDLKTCLTVLLESMEDASVSMSAVENNKKLYKMVHSEYTKLSKDLKRVQAKDKSRNVKMFNMVKHSDGKENRHSAKGDGDIVEIEDGVDDRKQTMIGASMNTSSLSTKSTTNASSSSKSFSKTTSTLTSLYCDADETTTPPTANAKGDDRMTIQDVIISMRDMDAAAMRYERDGQLKEARKLRMKIASMQQILNEHRLGQTNTKTGNAENLEGSEIEAPSETMKKTSDSNSKYSKNNARAMDFRNPSAAMIKDAKELHGLDLTDERVQNMLAGLNDKCNSMPREQGPKTNTDNNAPISNQNLMRYLKEMEFMDLAKRFADGYDKLTLMGMLYNRIHYQPNHNSISTSTHKMDGKGQNERSCLISLPQLDLKFTSSPRSATLNEIDGTRTISIDSELNVIYDIFTRSLTEDFLYLYDKNQESHANVTSITAIETNKKDTCGGVDIESVLLVYVTPFSVSLSNIIQDISIWYNHPQNVTLLFKAIMKEMSSGVTPYVVGFFVTIIMVFLWNRFLRMYRLFMYAATNSNILNEHSSYLNDDDNLLDL